MTKEINKRQVYIWDENLAFYDSVKNKSRLINLLIKQYMEELDINDGTRTDQSPDTEVI